MTQESDNLITVFTSKEERESNKDTLKQTGGSVCWLWNQMLKANIDKYAVEGKI